MSTYVTSQRFMRAAAVVFVILAVVAALVESRRDENATVLTPLAPGEADAPVHELSHCRAVTFDDAPVLETCRRLWAENRRHFFASTRSQQLSVPLVPDAPAGVKNQERIPQQDVDQRGTR